MATLEITWAGEKLLLLPEKGVFWPRESTLLVADLHLGKAAAFRRSGIAVPETTTLHDLQRLETMLLETGSRRLVILGDFFHAAAGRQPAMMEAVRAWCGQSGRPQILLVPGNHDRKAGPPPEGWNLKSADPEWKAPPFLFCHEPREETGYHVLSGHVHPAISLRDRFGSGLRAPCFCFGKRRAILPAFGSFTGMHNVQPAPEERIFAVGIEEIIEVTHAFRPDKGTVT